VTDSDARCDEPRDADSSPDAPRMIFEIRSVEGEEAERLRLHQTRVIREVVEWLAQKRSRNGQDNAA
jgi:hypothetical protein